MLWEPKMWLSLHLTAAHIYCHGAVSWDVGVCGLILHSPGVDQAFPLLQWD